jgi:hypothetical protein
MTIIPSGCKTHQHLWGHEKIGGIFVYTLVSFVLQLGTGKLNLGICGENPPCWERFSWPNSHKSSFFAPNNKLSTPIGDNLALIHNFIHKSFHKAGSNKSAFS